MGEVTQGTPYFVIVPLLVFGPIVLIIFYQLGVKELFRKREGDDVELTDEEKEAERKAEERRQAKRGSGRPVGTVRKPNKSISGYIVQGITYSWFACVLGILSFYPPYQVMGKEEAIIKISINVPGERKVPCVKRTRKELMELAPNMRKAMKCSRERWPVDVELELDGKLVYQGTEEPAGLSKDGASTFYDKRYVPTGKHKIVVRMRNNGSSEDFNFQLEETVDMFPGRSLAVVFNRTDKKIELKN